MNHSTPPAISVPAINPTRTTARTLYMTDVSQVVRERLTFIDFCLYFLGRVSRQDLMSRFNIAPAVTTRDFALYRSLAPDNLLLDGASKVYVVSEAFSPLFDYDLARVMSQLSRGFGLGANELGEAMVPCEYLPVLNHPDMAVLAQVSRAIANQSVVRVAYLSTSSGESTREIAPFALVSDGLRWHTRAFDRKTGGFRDFVLTRIVQISALPAQDAGARAQKHEQAGADDQWTRMVEIDLIPHPLNETPDIAARDFAMSDGKITVKLRAAVAGYMLQQWHVDCSPDRSIRNRAYRLCLANPLQVYGVGSMSFAPGYSSE